VWKLVVCMGEREVLGLVMLSSLAAVENPGIFLPLVSSLSEWRPDF
jgi:hypothetical protein